MVEKALFIRLPRGLMLRYDRFGCAQEEYCRFVLLAAPEQVHEDIEKVLLCAAHEGQRLACYATGPLNISHFAQDAHHIAEHQRGVGHAGGPCAQLFGKLACLPGCIFDRSDFP